MPAEPSATRPSAHFARFGGRRVDAIFVLDDFEADGRIGPAWGEARAEMVKRFTRFSYRVSNEGLAATYSYTSGVRYNASSATVDTVERAIEQILRHRREELGDDAEKPGP